MNKSLSSNRSRKSVSPLGFSSGRNTELKVEHIIDEEVAEEDKDSTPGSAKAKNRKM